MPSAKGAREAERPLRRRSLLALTAIRAPYLAVLRLHEFALFLLLGLAITWAVSRTIGVRTDALPDPAVHEQLWAFAWGIFALRWTYLQWRERTSVPRGQRFSLAWSAGVAFLLLEATSLVSNAAGLMMRRRLVDEGVAADAARDLEALANFVDANGKRGARYGNSTSSLYDFAEVLESNAVEGARLPRKYAAPPASRPYESSSAFGTVGPEVTKSPRPRRPICSLRELAIILEAKKRSRSGAAELPSGQSDSYYNRLRLASDSELGEFRDTLYEALLRCPAGSDLYQIVTKYAGRRHLKKVPIMCFESECDMKTLSECIGGCNYDSAVSLGAMKNMRTGVCAASKGQLPEGVCGSGPASPFHLSDTTSLAILLSFIVGIAGIAALGNVALAAAIVGAIAILVPNVDTALDSRGLIVGQFGLGRLGLWFLCLYLGTVMVMIIKLRKNRGRGRFDDVFLSVIVLGPAQLLCYFAMFPALPTTFASILVSACIGLMVVLPAPVLSKYRNLPRLS